MQFLCSPETIILQSLSPASSGFFPSIRALTSTPLNKVSCIKGFLFSSSTDTCSTFESLEMRSTISFILLCIAAFVLNIFAISLSILSSSWERPAWASAGPNFLIIKNRDAAPTKNTTPRTIVVYLTFFPEDEGTK
ncbi:MAG: hypothetical protein FVQ82_13645 [Planctomycetes bacterium]|nr:hypothetical protein [Planctomycetota bacterium]